MTGIVIDASVAIKWVVDEEGSGDAVRLIGGPKLSAPDLLMPECANILWKKARRGELTRDEALMAIDLIARADIELVPTRALASAATALSLDLDHPAYDCLYLALAIERDDVFVTADKRFVRLVTENGAPGTRGVSLPVGSRWFRRSGGMPPTHLSVSARPLSGRYLSFAERKEIALLRVRGTASATSPEP